MPKKGWKAITVPDELYALLEEKAKKQGRSLPALVEHLLEQDKKSKASKHD